MSKKTVIRDVSDTARWVAVYRARETERPDAVFRDPFAKRLAGARGEEILASMPFAEKTAWPFVVRTWLIDRMIAERVAEGTDMVVNLAAGLDARPYRLDLPASLQWIEVDLPEILQYKEEILKDDRPVCRLERVKLDLSNEPTRRELFQRLGSQAKRVLVIAEGLLVYFSEDSVASLAQDLAIPDSFRHWVIDLGSPGLIKMLKKRMGAPLDQAGAPLLFGPKDGPEYFRPYGWKALEVHSAFHAAAKLRRLPLFLRLMARLSSPNFTANRPWSAICLLARV